VKNSAVAFSIFVAVIITLFLVFSIFGILYFYWGDATAVKDSLSTIAGFFGGFATLGAAVIAAYLFNDWREQERITFIRNIAHETASLITQLMLSMQQYPQPNVFEIKVLHSKIATNLSFLNRQIEDGQMDKMNKHFGMFVKDFYSITTTEINNSPSQEQIKKEINKNIISFTAEYTYISELIDIDKVYKKVKAST